ncbi:MAG: hypothetical protein GC185_04415 [Alphaproteobacteria bacterium]|nr:hypothetical protein [Alphaproteobacteria bacterium]
MRPFPGIKPAIAVMAALALVAAPSGARAQMQPTYTSGSVSPQQTIATQQQLQQAIGNAMATPPAGYSGAPAPASSSSSSGSAMTQEELDKELKDHDSPQYKAHLLAKHAKADQDLFNGADEDAKPQTVTREMPTPPEMDSLQNVAASHPGEEISDDPVTRALSLDMRRDSQREAALSYGARGGLAKRSYMIMERLGDYETTFDRVFNFRALLVRAPSGLMIEPPIISEELKATVITPTGDEAAVADQILKINKQAKIVTAPRDWRQYLDLDYVTDIPPPPRVLWPKNKQEQLNWNQWVKQGWEAGYEQGEGIFEADLNKLVADYKGMVRYRMLLAQGKISQPYALQEDRGVTGGKSEMRVGDRALRITGPSQFLTGADLWKPADR